MECLPEDSSKAGLSPCIQEEHLTLHSCSFSLNKLPLSPGGGWSCSTEKVPLVSEGEEVVWKKKPSAMYFKLECL